MKLLFLLQILVCYGIIACAEEQGRDPVLNNSDIGSSNNEIFIFIVAQTEVAGDYSICFRKLGTNNCMSSDSEGKFEAMRFSAYGGENVSILATYEDRDLSCNASIPV